MDAMSPAPTDQAATAFLLGALPLARPTTIVDVGANPINEAPYSGLLRMGGCHVVGFEPQAEAFAALDQSRGPHETYFPFAVGSGAPVTLRIYHSSGMTSIFPPYLPSMRLINRRKMGVVDREVTLDTVALDQIADLPAFDMLKIDIQGAETLVFQHARDRLQTCLAVIVELRYLRLYRGEPMLAGVDAELRKQGFGLHKFLHNRTMMIANSQAPRLRPKRNADQLIDGDGVYLRDLAHAESYSDAQLMHLAILASGTFSSHTVALHCLDLLVARGAVPETLPAAYVDHLPAELRLA